MASEVFYCDLRTDLKRNLVQKLDDLIEKVGLPAAVSPGALAALKIHFGELGNTAFIRPSLAARFAAAVRRAGGKPFFTDANTLYVGTRSDAASHLETALANGFAYSVVGAPLIIADGLKGREVKALPVDLPECSEAYMGAAVAEADILVSLAHFKAHELAGFGGAIKNLGMGSAGRRGKLFMHANVSPKVKVEKCIACGRCIERCPVHCIKLVKRTADEKPPEGAERPDFRASKDDEACIGCGDCVLACPVEAMEIPWDAQIPDFQRRMVAYSKALISGREASTFCFNFVTQVSPACDCYPFADAPIVADIGILASRDPIAIDQASADLVNRAPGLAGSKLKTAHEPGEDKFRDLYPNIDWTIQLAYGQEVGLGSREYELSAV